jgi:hypothetical protein
MRSEIAVVKSFLWRCIAGVILFHQPVMEASPASFQTNVLNHTTVIIGYNGDTATLKATVQENEPPHGWIIWDVEISDNAGKTEKLRTGWSFKVSNLGFQPGPLKISARGLEFISAGFAAPFKTNSIQTLTITERAKLLGAREGFLFGQGNFRVSNGVPAIDVDELWPPDKFFHSEFQDDQWVASFPSKAASIVLLYEPTPDRASIKARLRERDKRNGGSLFAPWRQHEFKTGASTMLRHFTFQNPSSPDRIEAEIVVHHPSAEFIIEPQF